MREPPVRCPACEVSVQPDDLLRHRHSRCQGEGEPNKWSRWLTWSQAREYASERVLRRWVQSGRVRTRGHPRGRKYLMRDVVRLVAMRRIVVDDDGCQ